MNEEKILTLYKEKNHWNEGLVQGLNSSMAANASCGDEVVLTAEIVDGHIAKIQFSGAACSLCQASAELLCRLLEHKAVSDVRAEELKQEMWNEFSLDQNAPRAACVLLPYQALEKLVKTFSLR